MVDTVKEKAPHPHRLGKYAAIFGIVLLLLVAGLLSFLHTSPARQYALEQVTKLLQQQNVEFDTDQLSYNLLDLSLTLRNVRIRSREYPDLPPFASIDRLDVDLSLGELLQRRFVLQSGEATGVAVHYVVTGDGRENLPRSPRDPEQPAEPLNYLIEELRVRNANVRYENHAQRIDLTLPISTLEVKGDATTDRHAARLEAAGGQLSWQERRVTIGRLAGELDIGEDDVSVKRLDLDAEGARVSLTGAITQFSDPQTDLTLRGTIDAARASALAGLADRVSGIVNLDVTVKGPIATPTVAGRIAGTDVGYRNLTDLALTTNASYDVATKRATFSELQLRAPFGNVSGSGVISAAADDTSRVAATISGLDAAHVMRAFETPYVVASRVDASVDAEWPALEFVKASGSATATLTPNGRLGRSVIPAGGRLQLIGRVGAVDAVLTRVTAAGAELNGRIRVVDQRDLRGEAQFAIRNVAETLAATEAVLGRRDLLPTAVGGAVSGTARLSGSLEAPTVAADLRAPSLSVGDASGIALNAGVNYTPALVTVRELAVQWQQAQARASGTVGLTGARPLDLTLSANSLQISELMRAFNQTNVPASGTLTLQGRVSGTIQQPAAALTLTAADLTVYSETWGRLSSRVNVANRQVTIADMVLDKPQPQGNGQITGSGSYHLDQRRYTADIRSQNVQLLSLALPGGRQVRGTLQLTAAGSGTIDQPAATIDLVADALTLDRYEIGRFNARTVVVNGQAAINASIPSYQLNATGTIATTQPYATTAKIRVDSLQLETLPLDLETPLDGQLRATVDISGNLAALEQMRGDALIESFSGSWNQQPFRIDGPARLRYANERLAIDQLRLVAQDSTVTVRGELPLRDTGAPGAIDIDARANLATLAAYAPADTSVTATGQLTLNGTLRGTLRAIDPDLILVIGNGQIVTPQLMPGLSRLNVRARVGNGEATIEQLVGQWGSATINAAGRVPLDALPDLPVEIPRRGGPTTFTARIDGLDVTQIPGAPQGLTGRITLEATMSATRADLGALEGLITLPELQLAFNGLTLEQQQVSTIQLANGVARVQQFRLTGTVGNVSAAGTIALATPRAIDVDVTGNVNVAAISVFTDAIRAEGETTLNIAARGTVTEPDLTGFVDLRDATFVVDEPTIAANNVNARVLLAGRRMSVAELVGNLNGGTLTGSGFVELGAGGIADAALEVATSDVAFDAPLDLRSVSDAKLRFRRREDEYILDGQVTLEEAGLTGDINFDEGLLAALAQRRTLDLTEQRNPLLDRVRFDVNIDTATPIVVDNNLARAEVTADLRLIGTPYEPGLAGRLTVLEESQITLNERRYEVERGDITFLDERRIVPQFDLRLATTARNYDIIVTVSGTPGDTEASLTSVPTLPEPDIMALLATGRTLDEMRGEEYEVAREQMLSYLTGRVGSQLGRGLRGATGFDTVRVEPNFIANEADPSARLTVGEEIAETLEIVYSVNLADSNDQIWVAEYDVTRRFQTRGVRQSDNSFRFDIRHDLRFGGTPEPARIPRQRPFVNSFTITGDAKLPAAELQDALNVEEGEQYNFFAAREGVEEIEETLEERHYLQSRVRLTRAGDNRAVDVNLHVVAGPTVQLVFEGASPPSDVIDEIRTTWRRGVFDTQRLDDGVEAIRAWLMEEDYLQPTVQGTIEELSPEERRVRFGINPGVRFAQVVLAFEGARGIEPNVLDDIINEQNLERELFTDPVQVTELLERYYREQGYLTAAIASPVYDFQGTHARIILQVTEGPRFFVRDVTTAGNAVIPATTLAGELPLRTGDPFLPFAAENALEHIRDRYWRLGYNDVRTDYALVLDREAGRADVRFEVVEGPQSIVADITVIGNEKTSERLIREQLELTPLQPLDLGALARSRRNLYDTQAFSVADITRESLVAESSPDSAANTPGAPSQRPVRLNVSVREVQPVQLRYGVSYDTERGLGGIFDVSGHNSLGKARVIGMQSRYDSQLTEFRAYISQPSLKYLPIHTIAAIYYRDETNPDTELTRRFDVDRRGASINQERELGDDYVVNWGFRYEKARSYDPLPDGSFNELLTVTPLSTALTRETRDEVLDATRGAFMSHSFSYSPTWLGADRAYIKYYGQYFHYFPLQREGRERFTNEILRPRFVYAAGIRVGLAHPFGNLLLPTSERFFAGGSNTLRGFEQNALGPIGPDGLPQGGDALLLINNEVRFPLVSIFDGVAFSDIGNVFPRVSDISFSDFRETAGLGLRARTRWFLLRGDYGILLDRRAGERRGRFYFSIGQAF